MRHRQCIFHLLHQDRFHRHQAIGATVKYRHYQNAEISGETNLKILGVGDNKYICEVEVNELMSVMGTDDFYLIERVGAGDEIALDRVIKSAKWIRNIDDTHINALASQLRTVLVGLEKVKADSAALNLFNKIRDSEDIE